MFDIKFTKQSEKFLSKCENTLFNRIKRKTNDLRINPVPSDAKRLQGYKDPTFRIRVGKYRILYELKEVENLIIIIKIDKRERVYD